MKLNILILPVSLFIFFTPLLLQSQNKDSLNIRQKPFENEVLIPTQSFIFFNDPFYFNLRNIKLSNELLFTQNLSASSPYTDIKSLIALNNQDFLKQINLNYQQSKPNSFEKFMGMVNVAGAAALAGYHIYKYHIKEKKKF